MHLKLLISNLLLNFFKRINYGTSSNTSVIQNLIQRELLELNVSKDEEGKFTEYMNLDPFYHKLNQLLKHQYLKHEEQDKRAV